MHPSLSGHSIIATGASSGIGKTAATLLAERGARVVLADLPDAGGQVVKGAIESVYDSIVHDIAATAAKRRSAPLDHSVA